MENHVYFSDDLKPLFMIRYIVPLLMVMVLFTCEKRSYANSPEIFPNSNVKSTSIVWPEIKVKAALGSLNTSTSIKFGDDMKLGLDFGYDAGIMKSGFDIYTRLVEDNGVDFGIQCLPMSGNTEMVIPLGVESTTAGTLTLSVELNNLPAQCQLIFEDRVLGTFKTITANETLATLSVLAKSKITDRFFLNVTFVYQSVKTKSVASVSTSGAVINCEIEAGTAIARGVAYSTQPNPDFSSSKKTDNGQFEEGSFSIQIDGIREGTTYYVRSFMVTASDTIWGNEISFSTKAKTLLTVTAHNKSRYYGEENPALTYTCSGFINGDNEDVLDSKPEISVNTTKESEAGRYGITISGGYDNDYEFSYQSGELTILKAQLTASVASIESRVGVIPDFSITYNGFVNGDSINNIDQLPIATANANAASLPGEYPISLSGGSDNNYEFIYIEGTLTLNKKILPTIEWESPSGITYGNKLDNSELNATTDVPGKFIYSPEVGTLLEAGKAQTLEVIFIPTDTINYISVSESVTIDVEKALLTVKANDATIVYGEPIPELTYTTEGFVNGESESSLIFGADMPGNGNNGGLPQQLPSLPKAYIEQGKGINVGIYPIKISGGLAANYDFIYIDGKLTIEKALLTVQVADGQMFVGSTEPKFNLIIQGFKYSDSESNIDTLPKIVISITSSTPVGEYEIVANGGSDDNYQFDYKSGILKIIPKLTTVIKWEKPLDVVYGDKLSSVQLNATSTIEGKFEYQPSIGTKLNAGLNQPLTVIFTPNTADYETVADTVFITIEKKSLMVLAHNQTMFEGDELPAFTVGYEGFIDGDKESNLGQLPVASTTATKQSEAGEYAITVDGGSDENYNFIYTNGLLTIQKKNGLEEVNSNSLNIYRNKNDRSITIENTSSYQGSYQLYDLAGRTYSTGKVHCGKTTLQTPQQGNRLFLLKLKVGKESRMFKIID